MRIGIDCRKILNPEKGESAGIGHYTYQLVRNLLKLDSENQYVLFFDHSIREKKIAKFKKSNTVIRYFPFSQYARFLPSIYEEYLIAAALERENLDVFHSPLCVLPKNYKGACLVTLHDLAEFKSTGCFPPKECEEMQRSTSEAINKARRIITVSNSTKDDLLYLFEIDPRNVSVVYNGVDNRFFEVSSPSEIRRVKNKLGIVGDYILYVGLITPKKNILRLVAAFEELKKYRAQSPEFIKDYQLVLAGNLGYGGKSKVRQIQSSKFKADIIIPGYVDADDINALYGGASVFAFPSLYEGFGLPLLEAMAKGVPVLTSNVSAMPEVVGKAALTVNPLETSEIFAGLLKIVSDKDLRQRLIDDGLEHAKNFRWQDTAQKTLDIYKTYQK